MRGIKNIRQATFADAQIEVGDMLDVMYVRGLSGKGVWSRLQKLPDEKYQLILPDGQRIEGRLQFADIAVVNEGQSP